MPHPDPNPLSLHGSLNPLLNSMVQRGMHQDPCLVVVDQNGSVSPLIPFSFVLFLPLPFLCQYAVVLPPQEQEDYGWDY